MSVLHSLSQLHWVFRFSIYAVVYSLIGGILVALVLRNSSFKKSPKGDNSFTQRDALGCLTFILWPIFLTVFWPAYFAYGLFTKILGKPPEKKEIWERFKKAGFQVMEYREDPEFPGEPWTAGYRHLPHPTIKACATANEGMLFISPPGKTPEEAVELALELRKAKGIDTDD